MSGNEDKGRLLNRAVQEGNLELVNQLISQGADVNWKNPRMLNQTPLHMAGFSTNVRMNDPTLVFENENEDNDFIVKCEIADILIKRGADVNARDNTGRTPLHFACQSGNINLVNMLIENGALVNERDNRGRTPLHFAALSSDCKLIATLLLKGADDTIPDNDSKLPRDMTYPRTHRRDLLPSNVLLDNYGKMKMSFLSCGSLKCPVFTKAQADILKTAIRSSPELRMVYEKLRSNVLITSSLSIMRSNKFNFLHDEMSRDMLDMFDSESFGENMELFEEEKNSKFNYSKDEKEANRYIQQKLGESSSSSSASSKSSKSSSGGRRKSRKSRKSYNKKGKSRKSRKSRR